MNEWWTSTKATAVFSYVSCYTSVKNQTCSAALVSCVLTPWLSPPPVGNKNVIFLKSLFVCTFISSWENKAWLQQKHIRRYSTIKNVFNAHYVVSFTGKNSVFCFYSVISNFFTVQIIELQHKHFYSRVESAYEDWK